VDESPGLFPSSFSFDIYLTLSYSSAIILQEQVVYSIVSTGMSVQQVYWSVLAIFFVLVILSWWVASRDWFKEDRPAEQHKEQDEQAQELSE
jgi:hypothetical protein